MTASGIMERSVPQDENMIGKTAKAEPGMGGAAIATMTETKTSFASIIVSTDPADIYVRTQTIEPSIIAPQGIYMTMPSGSPKLTNFSSIPHFCLQHFMLSGRAETCELVVRLMISAGSCAEKSSLNGRFVTIRARTKVTATVIAEAPRQMMTILDTPPSSESFPLKSRFVKPR